jgi:hypothetical protein
MVYNIRNYWVFGAFPSSGILETFRKLNLVLPSGEWGKTSTQLGLLIRANLNHCEVSSF